MVRRWLWILARSIAVGWAVLIVLTYLAERPLLLLTAPIVGAHWVATASLTLNCLELAATGWVIGRLHRTTPLPGVLAFAATLSLFSLEAWLPLDVPGLIRLAMDALHDTRYWGPFANMTVQHVLLFGSLIAGGLLSRPPQTPLSLFGETPQ
jgi:hypothetical protein